MINLLPPQRLANLRLARSNTILRRYIELVIISVIILLAAVALAYYFLHDQQVNTRQTVELNQQKITQLEPFQKQAQQLSLTVNTIAGLMAHNVKFSEMLTQVGGVTPSGAVLTGLQFSIEDLKSPLIISAQVDTEQKAAILRNNLAGSTLFSKAEIQSITQTGASGTTSSVPNNSDTTAGAGVASTSPYKFTTVINAYFKNNTVVGKP